MTNPISTRRRVLAAASFSGLAASFRALSQGPAAPRLAGEPQGRVAPPNELVNAGEFEEAARRKLDGVTFGQIAGTEHAALDRITLRPRLMVDTTKIDLTATLFGQQMLMPILAGPVAQQKRFHPDGELAMVRGVSAAKSLMVISGDASFPVDRIASEAKCPLWYQLWTEPDTAEVRKRVEKAIGAGCKALLITIDSGRGDAQSKPSTGIDWSALDRIRRGLSLPVVLKGVMSPQEAQKAASAGVQGIVVSSYSSRPVPGSASSIEVLPSIADAVAGKVTILVDGSFRFGSDVLKALALGAQGILLGRPPVWGLASYGEQGVQDVIELIQSSFARDMAMCGKVDLKALDRTAVAIHRR